MLQMILLPNTMKNQIKKIKQKIIDYLCNKNVVIVKIKNQDL